MINKIFKKDKNYKIEQINDGFYEKEFVDSLNVRYCFKMDF